MIFLNLVSLSKDLLKPKRALCLCIAFLTLTFTFNSTAGEQNSARWNPVPATTDSGIRVESLRKNGQEVQVVHLPDGESIEIPFDAEIPAILESKLTQEEIRTVREHARETLELTLKGILSDDFSGNMVVDARGEAIALESAKAGGQRSKKVNVIKRLLTASPEFYKPGIRGTRVTAKFAGLVRSIWNFIVVETIKAGANYYRKLVNTAPRFTEFGIAIVIKLEPQVFIAKFNPTQKFKPLSRNYGINLELSFNRVTHKIRIRSRLRREKGAGGLGLPAMKAEFKIFESDNRAGAYKGKSWYPVSPPLVSFVLDSSPHYFAQGITIGLNTGDAIPGSTLANTFTEFVQTDNFIRFEEIPERALGAIQRATPSHLPRRQAPGHLMCSQLFAR